MCHERDRLTREMTRFCRLQQLTCSQTRVNSYKNVSSVSFIPCHCLLPEADTRKSSNSETGTREEKSSIAFCQECHGSRGDYHEETRRTVIRRRSGYDETDIFSNTKRHTKRHTSLSQLLPLQRSMEVLQQQQKETKHDTDERHCTSEHF